MSKLNSSDIFFKTKCEKICFVKKKGWLETNAQKLEKIDKIISPSTNSFCLQRELDIKK